MRVYRRDSGVVLGKVNRGCSGSNGNPCSFSTGQVKGKCGGALSDETKSILKVPGKEKKGFLWCSADIHKVQYSSKEGRLPIFFEGSDCPQFMMDPKSTLNIR